MVPVAITAPAAKTLAVFVASAAASKLVNLVRSALVIMAPEPTLVTSLRAVTLLVVYIPFVTVEAFPVKAPTKEVAVTVPPLVILLLPRFISPPRVRLDNVPTLVRLDPVIPDPKVVALNISVPFIFKTFPVGTFT